MTERKPQGMSFASWIDQQISEAADRGAFDDLPGAGQPLPRRPDDDDGQAWAREYAIREGVPVADLLPTPLRLRRESALLPETVRNCRSELQVREVVEELNKRIMDWRRIPLGPPIFVPLVDAQTIVSAWQDEQLAAPPAQAPADAVPKTRQRDAARLRRWRRRAAN